MDLDILNKFINIFNRLKEENKDFDQDKFLDLLRENELIDYLKHLLKNDYDKDLLESYKHQIVSMINKGYQDIDIIERVDLNGFEVIILHLEYCKEIGMYKNK